MPKRCRSILSGVFSLAAVLAWAQPLIQVNYKEPERVTQVELADLQGSTTEVYGLGKEVAGLDLIRSNTLHHFGDGEGLASPALEDSTWSEIRSLTDSVMPGQGVHWLRTWLQLDQDLKGVPVLVNIALDRAVQVYLNGLPVMGIDTLQLDREKGGVPGTDSLAMVSLPMVFRCDGRPELVAIRFVGEAGSTLRDMDVEVSMHTADVNYGVQRRVMHFGVFAGINFIILLLSLVIWSLERKAVSWLWLALLSFVSVLGIVCDVGSSMGLMGLSQGLATALDRISTLILAWPQYLLLMVMCSMGVQITTRRKRLYHIGVVVVTCICAMGIVAENAGLLTTENGVALLNDEPWLIVPGLFLILLLGVIVVWFAIDIIRLGVRLLRAKDHARWIGGGALGSSLLALLLNIPGTAETVYAGWFSLAGDYCSYVAVPVSIAVYLAIRSAHHNRLVERQRDELDLEVQERTAELRTERDRSDALLLNILPAEVAEELKSQGSSEARHFDQASVLFTDFKGFTQLSEKVGPGELLKELNACFKAFDDIISARGIEKIKTIGDAYMCAAGLPDPLSAKPVDVVLAALEMQEFMLRRKVERTGQGKPAFDMRLGIHSGPVVAGIVGVKKFQYDIWGDTVNTASRMESTGEVGEVNISGSTYALVKDTPGLSFIPRGRVDVKGKEAMEMFFVRRSAASA